MSSCISSVVCYPFTYVWNCTTRVFCTIHCKKAATYHRLLLLLITKCAELISSWLLMKTSPTLNVVRALFPASSPNGCLFHFGQALWRKLQKLGMSPKYGKEDNGASKWFGLFTGTHSSNHEKLGRLTNWSRAHTHMMFAGVSRLSTSSWTFGFQEAIWLPCRTMQFRSDVPRTNNSCVGYNSHLTKRALQRHLNICALIRIKFIM